MTSRLLTLTFHAPKILLLEDAMFKKHAIASSLIDSEVLGKVIPDSLTPSKKAGPASGISGSSYPVGPGGTFQISLNELGVNAWWRSAFKSRQNNKSEFETWIKPKIEQPCSCLLIGGHHAPLQSGGTVVWGQEDSREKHRYFTALIPSESNGDPTLEIWGNPYQKGRDAVLRAGPFDFKNALKTCRLVVIMGCNGVDGRVSESDESKATGLLWQRWVELASGKKPVVLGWYGVHSMPRDADNETFSKRFWEQLESLATTHSTDLSGLCESHPSEVIKAWGDVLKQTYAKSVIQRHLWYDYGTGAGAVDPEGKIWKVTSLAGPIEIVS